MTTTRRLAAILAAMSQDTAVMGTDDVGTLEAG